MLILIVIFPLFAQADNSAADYISERLESPRPLKVEGLLLNRGRLLQLYKSREYKPLWLAENHFPFTKDQYGFSKNTYEFLEIFASADEEGLELRDYFINLLDPRIKEPGAIENIVDTELLLTDRAMQYFNDLRNGRAKLRKTAPKLVFSEAKPDAATLLQQALEARDLKTYLKSAEPPHPEYAELKAKLKYYQDIAAQGGWNKIPSGLPIKPGMEDGRLPELSQRLMMESYLSIKDEIPPVYSDELVEAVMAFQGDHNLPPDGVIGISTLNALNVPVENRIRQIKLNMERWRWLPDNLGGRYILVNIPAFNLQAMEDNKIALEMKVIIGMPVHSTPVFNSEMSEVIFHPYWYAPDRLSFEHILPELQEDPNAAITYGYELFREVDGRLQKVDMNEVDWNQLARNDFDHYLFRQRPGPLNALGSVKFRIANNDDIYMHDTPNRDLFIKDMRALSNGCIRLEQPLELAKFALSNNQDWPEERIEALYNESSPNIEPTAVKLPELLPVYILYFTVEPGEGEHLHFYRDIYKKDALLTKLL